MAYLLAITRIHQVDLFTEFQTFLNLDEWLELSESPQVYFPSDEDNSDLLKPKLLPTGAHYEKLSLFSPNAHKRLTGKHQEPFKLR